MTERERRTSYHTEEFEVSGERVLGKIKELIQAGNIRKITIKNEQRRTLLEIPLAVGVVVGVVAPVLAAVGALAALVAKCVIVVEKVEKEGAGDAAAEGERGHDAESGTGGGVDTKTPGGTGAAREPGDA